EIVAVAEQPPEAFLLVRRRDDQHRPNPAEHERRQRVVHHRLAVDRDELLAHGARQRMKARSRAAREDDALQQSKYPALTFRALSAFAATRGPDARDRTAPPAPWRTSRDGRGTSAPSRAARRRTGG